MNQRASRWLLAGLAMVLALLVRALLDPWLGDEAAFSTVFAAVAVAAWIGDWRSAVVVAVLGYVATDWFFVSPRGTLGIGDLANATAAGVYALSSAIIVIFGHVARTARARSDARLEDVRRHVEQRDRLLLELGEAERGERETHDRLRLALDAAGAALAEWDPGSGRMTWDDRFYGLLGFEPGSVEPSYELWRSRVHPDDLAWVESEGRRCFDGNLPFDARFRLLLPDRTVRWVQSCGITRREPDGARVIVNLAFDITRRKVAELTLAESERALRAANAELSEVDRRKDEFLAMLGHELRNPLGAIGNSVQLLRRSSSDEPAVTLARDIIGRQVGHLTRIIDDLLDVSRVTQGKIVLRPESADLRTAVGLGVELTRVAVEEKRQRLTVTMPPGPVMVTGETSRLAQVVGNLLNNASKFSDAGASIGAELALEPGEAVLRVTDEGVGIAPAMLPRIFDVFVQGEQPLDRSRGGLGVGLALARALVELHGGTIQAASDGPGRGSRFEVRLPLLEAAATRSGGPAAGTVEPASTAV